MLRHGCGYALANAGHDTRAIQDWMGHKDIQHTARYTKLEFLALARLVWAAPSHCNRRRCETEFRC
jgi:site-specific recombinase XerD